MLKISLSKMSTASGTTKVNDLVKKCKDYLYPAYPDQRFKEWDPSKDKRYPEISQPKDIPGDAPECRVPTNQNPPKCIVTYGRQEYYGSSLYRTETGELVRAYWPMKFWNYEDVEGLLLAKGTTLYLYYDSNGEKIAVAGHTYPVEITEFDRIEPASPADVEKLNKALNEREFQRDFRQEGLLFRREIWPKSMKMAPD